MRFCISLLVPLLLLASFRTRADEPAAESPRAELEALLQKFRDAPNKAAEERLKRNAATSSTFRGRFDKKSVEEAKAQRDALPSVQEIAAQTQPRAHSDGFLKLIEKHPTDPAALEALEWLFEFDEGSPQTLKASGLIRDEALQNERVVRSCRILTQRFSKAGDDFLQRVAEKNADRTVQAAARQSQALRLARKVDWARQEANCSEVLREELTKKHDESIENFDQAQLLKSGAAEAEALFKQAQKDYADVVFPTGLRFSDMIDADLRELRTLGFGCVAPDIEGLDMDGKPMKLSDARGHVVLLEFWGTWCGPCMALVPQHIALVQRLEGKPFLLLGINSDSDREAAKQRSREKGIIWRSWFDGGHERRIDGPIHRAWSIDSWPTQYLIDARGTIRFKGHLLRGKGEITDRNRFNPALSPSPLYQQFNYLDDCVDLLVKEAEAARADGSVTVGMLVPLRVRPSARSVLPNIDVFDSRKLTFLAASPAVQAELKVSDETAEKLTALQEDYLEALREEYEAKGIPMRGPFGPSVTQVKMQTLIRLDIEFGKKIKELLSEQQFRRLHEIRVQALKSGVLIDGEIAQELKLTGDQRNALSALSPTLNQKTMEMMNANRWAPREEFDAKMKAADVEREKSMAEILTVEQNAKFAEIRGEPFDLSTLYPRRPGSGRPGTPK